MSTLQYDSGPTSNDLLLKLVAKHTSAALNYQIVAQSAEDVQNTENAPVASMGAAAIANEPQTADFTQLAPQPDASVKSGMAVDAKNAINP